MSQKIHTIILLLIGMVLACGIDQQASQSVARATRTPLPTFTITPAPKRSPTPTPITLNVIDTPTLSPAKATSTATAIPIETNTSTPTMAPTNTPLPPTNTPVPIPTDTPTVTPTLEPVIEYVLANTQREFNCDFTYIYGTVKNANNFGLPDVEVRALGIHNTEGMEFTTHTDSEGRYEIFRIPLSELLAAEWAVMLMRDGREVSDRFHWGSTPSCESNDTGNSQALRIDWKLIE